MYMRCTVCTAPVSELTDTTGMAGVSSGGVRLSFQLGYAAEQNRQKRSSLWCLRGKGRSGKAVRVLHDRIPRQPPTSCAQDHARSLTSCRHSVAATWPGTFDAPLGQWGNRLRYTQQWQHFRSPMPRVHAQRSRLRCCRMQGELLAILPHATGQSPNPTQRDPNVGRRQHSQTCASSPSLARQIQQQFSSTSMVAELLKESCCCAVGACAALERCSATGGKLSERLLVKDRRLRLETGERALCAMNNMQ